MPTLVTVWGVVVTLQGESQTKQSAFWLTILGSIRVCDELRRIGDCKSVFGSSRWADGPLHYLLPLRLLYSEGTLAKVCLLPSRLGVSCQ
jgi:hypothetical protein